MSIEQADHRSDADLLGLVAEGDQRAFRDLVTRHMPRIVRTAERVVGNAADADEIAQEVLIRLWRRAADWEADGARLETWLYRVTVNLCIDRQRRNRTRQATQMPESDAPPRSSLDHLHAAEMGQIILGLLAQLTEKQRIATVLSYYEGLSVVEVAEILGSSPGTVWGILHRARQAMKARLTEEGIKGWGEDDGTA